MISYLKLHTIMMVGIYVDSAIGAKFSSVFHIGSRDLGYIIAPLGSTNKVTKDSETRNKLKRDLSLSSIVFTTM